MSNAQNDLRNAVKEDDELQMLKNAQESNMDGQKK